MKVPWEFSGGADVPTEMLHSMPNLPTPEGRALGAEIARLIDVPDACHDCAFRLGTDPNGCPTTLMDAIKCIAEGVPFYCHVKDGRVCAGYVAGASA